MKKYLLRREGWRVIFAILLALAAPAAARGAWPVAVAAAFEAGTVAGESSAQAQRLPHVEGLPNLTLVKEKLVAYHDCTCDCGCYKDDLARVGGQALAYLKHYLATHPDRNGKKLAIVLDIDDTSISNWENIRRHDYAFSRDAFVEWEREAKAPAIEPTLALFRYAREHGVAIFFITGRPEAERELTVKDLESAGYREWTRLVMRQPDSPRLAADYKSRERTKLREAGYVVILNMGDQESDLVGEPAGRTFKLPNPFYYVP